MDTHLTDLDALLLKVRDRRVREYIGEAVNAYRSGAYKAAVISCWVAVAFDILVKIREIAQGDDRAAKNFIDTFDAASNNHNTIKLLAIENDLLTNAYRPFGFISNQELIQLKRLKEDRNLCAHPSFSSEAELFQPIPDLVRTHIVHSVEMLLANAPMQGRAIIETFSADLLSSAFPRDREKTITYLKVKYISQMRPGVLVNFAKVLLKAFLRGDNTDWFGSEMLVLNSLHAVARNVPEIWRTHIRAIAVQLMGTLDGNLLTNAFPIFREFPELLQEVDQALRIRLSSIIENFDPNSDPSNAVFAAVCIPEFAAEINTAIARADDPRKMAIIRRYPDRAFIPVAFSIFANSKSYHEAESRFFSVIIPLADYLVEADIPKLLDIIQSHGQICAAAAIPEYLAYLVDRMWTRGQANSREYWDCFKLKMSKERYDQFYDPLWTMLDQKGLLTKG